MQNREISADFPDIKGDAGLDGRGHRITALVSEGRKCASPPDAQYESAALGALFVERIEHGFEDLEGEESAFLAGRGERDLKKVEHLLSLHFAEIFDVFAFDLLAEDGGGGLADGTTRPVEVSTGHDAVFIDLEFEVDIVAAEGVFVGVDAGRTIDVPLVIRGLEMLQNVFAIKIFNHGHGPVVSPKSKTSERRLSSQS